MQPLASALKIAFFASLFFLTIRFQGIPAPFVVGIGLVAAAFAQALIDLKKAAFRPALFDILFIAYVALAAIYIGFVPPATYIPDPWIVFGKTLAYASTYFALRSLKVTEREAYFGVLIGLILFCILFVYAFFVAGLALSDLSSFNFHRVTVRTGEVFSSLGSGTTVDTDFTSRDLLRSAMSEGFALSILLFLRAHALPPLLASLFLLLVFQSRRSALSVIAFLALSDIKWRFKLTAALAGLVVLILLAGTGVLERFASLASEQRLDMYYVALEGLSDRALAGFGYGAKVGSFYVHNFLLASFYMMGLAGLFLASAITVSLIADSIRYRSQFAIIALVGFAVGGTTEGFMNLAAWAGLALMYQKIAETRPARSKKARKPMFAI